MPVPGEKFVRVNYRHYHSWLIPRSAVCTLLSCAVIAMIIGIILLQFGSVLIPWGAVVFVVGVICLCICVCLCLHAYCIFQLSDQETQTTDEAIIISSKDSELSPTFTVLDKKPPPGPDHGVRNGRYGGGVGSMAKKQVSISPGVSIPIQHGPQQAQVSYVQANRGYPQTGVYTSSGGQSNQSSGQQVSGSHVQGSGGYGSTQSGGHLTGSSANQYGNKQMSSGNDLSHSGVSVSNMSGNYSGSGGHVTGNYPQHSTGPHVNIGYSQYGGGGQLSPGGYQASRSGTMSSVSSRGHSPGYGYPLQANQPTPYSTLTQKSATPVSVSHVQHGQVTKQTGGYDEDYDNTAETVPMIGHSQQQSSQSWRPSGSSRDDVDVPEPQPLVYPSERRPMTFEQTSTSKMSIYDNMYALDKLGE